MRNISTSPSASAAVGANAYCAPCTTDVCGAPLIVGARFGASLTVIVNAGKAALACPSLTLITMEGDVPTFAAVGMPCSCPVLELNVAHVGRFAIE